MYINNIAEIFSKAFKKKTKKVKNLERESLNINYGGNVMNNKKITYLIMFALMLTNLTSCTNEKSLNSDIKNNTDNSFGEINSDKLSNDNETIDGYEDSNRDELVAYDEYLILANKENYLDESYEPEDLRKVNIKFSGSSNMLRDVAATALEEMVEDAKKSGITLIGRSAYRSYNTQVETYKSKVQKLGQEEADKFSARPGASEHQTGLAIDILSSEYSKLHTQFQHTNSYKWLIENCAKYGFILRFPKGKSDITGYSFEPWHYRYVGKEHAEKIMNNGLTLEEYLNKTNNS